MPFVPFWTVDAFTQKPFAGNPAAVCWLDAPQPDKWMQSVAAEMNLSETAFVRPLPGDPAADYELRWLTPLVEVDLCGHATLATAHALWTTGRAGDRAEIRFRTRSGVLTCGRDGERMTLDFPALPITPQPVLPELLAALKIDAGESAVVAAGRSRFDWLVVLPSAAVVEKLQPDINLLLTVPTRGVIVTAAAEQPGVDFVSRFFCPAVGINEDPVCGSAHCVLTPYWSQRLAKSQLVARQVSARGGDLWLQHVNDRVRISGYATTVFEGRVLAVGS